MTTQPHRGFRLVLAIVFAGLGLMRLYAFAQTSLLADVLSGLGFLALAAGYVLGGSLVVARRDAPRSGPSAAAGYLNIAGIVLVLAAIVLRLTG